MATALTVDELITILEDLGRGEIGIEEAARRAHVWDTEPDRYRCGTCQQFKSGECRRPGQPVAIVHPHSVHCGNDYVGRRKSDEAMPAEPERHGSRMWK